ncbi:hypothetical protein B9T07_05335 [Limnospira fusiformis CCALA 023]|uniref:hypothetical protein n=1 Tax=Limnospira platensis TaxID=118562 RepID=UPI00396EF686
MNGLREITGSFKDEPAFEEILALGQAIRRGNESVLDAPNRMDARIVAIALSRSMILLTRNHRGFSKVTGLVIEDWTIGR